MAGIFDSMRGTQTTDSEIPFALRLMMIGNSLQNWGGRGQGGNPNASIIQSIMEQRQQSAEQAKKQKFLESYAANIDDPKLRQAILSGMVDPSELFKQDFELKKQQAGADQTLNLEKWKHENDPNQQIFKQLFGDLGGGPSGTGAGGATSDGAPVPEAQGPVTSGGAGPMALQPGATGVVDPFVARARKQFNLPNLTRDQAIQLGTAAAKGELPSALDNLRKSNLAQSTAAAEGVAKSIETGIAKEEFQGVSQAIGTPPKQGSPPAAWDAYATAVSDYAGFPVKPAQARAFAAYKTPTGRDKYLDDIRPKGSAVTVNNVMPGSPAATSNWVQSKTETDGSITYQDVTKDPTDPGAFKTIRPEGSKAAAEAADAAKVTEIKENASTTGKLRRITKLDRLIEIADEHPDAFGIKAQTGASNVLDRNAFVEGRGLMTSVAAEMSKEELQMMRDSSKTGGAVGQVTEEEWKRLASIQSELAAEGQNYDAPTFKRMARAYRTALYDVTNGTNFSGVYPEFDKNMPQRGPESGMRVGPNGSVRTSPAASTGLSEMSDEELMKQLE